MRNLGLILPAVCVIALLAASSCRDDTKSASTSLPSKQLQQIVHGEPRQEESCGKFVQSFYDRYVTPIKPDRQHKIGQLDEDDVLRLKKRLFNAKLFRLLQVDRDVQAQNPGYITGLESDPFLNSQDPSPKFQVQTVTVKSGNCRAIVWGVEDSKKRETVEPELSMQNGKWVFLNFNYPDAKHPWDNLVDELQMLQSNRKYTK